MDEARFDRLTKLLAMPSRRSLLAAGGTLLAGLLGSNMTATAKPKGKKKGKKGKKKGEDQDTNLHAELCRESLRRNERLRGLLHGVSAREDVRQQSVHQ